MARRFEVTFIIAEFPAFPPIIQQVVAETTYQIERYFQNNPKVYHDPITELEYPLVLSHINGKEIVTIIGGC